MAIKPVDFQVMIPRTIEASKASNDENQKNQTMLQQQAASSQQRAENSVKQVYSRSNTQNVKISERQKEKENSGNNKKKKGKADDDEGNALKKSLQTSTIDIKI